MSFTSKQIAELKKQLKEEKTETTAATIGNSIKSIVVSSSSNPWILDSGASKHMTGEKRVFDKYIPCSKDHKVEIADGSVATVMGKGRNLPLKVFGSICFVHNLAPIRSKLDPRSIRCMFLGYFSTQKGYKCYSRQQRKVYICRDVTFLEQVPFYPPVGQ